MITIHKQEWHDFTRLAAWTEFGSIQAELYDKKQDFGGTAFIYALWVQKESRRQGLAKKLLHRIEEEIKKLGHDSVFLEWKEKDTPPGVLYWYRNEGYEDVILSKDGGYYLLKKRLK